jgi:hypothetical protein
MSMTQLIGGRLTERSILLIRIVEVPRNSWFKLLTSILLVVEREWIRLSPRRHRIPLTQ